MIVPTTFPGLRQATILLGVTGFIWIALEGDLRRDTLLGIWVMIVAVLQIMERVVGGRQLSRPRWLAVTSLAGLLCGAGSVLTTISLMALKTGLHAHGPEFTPAEVAGVWAQLPLWSLVGAIAGLGLGLIAAALDMRPEPPK